jgi:hypothetical protein
MKRHILIAVASLLMVGSAGLRAEDTKEAPKPATGEHAEKKKKTEAEKLSPEERAKRRKEATAKRELRLKELREKKAAGTLNDADKTQLERLEKQAERSKRPKKDGAAPQPKKETATDVK